MSYIVLSPRDVTAKKSISKLPQNLWVDNRNQINNFLCDYQYWVQVPGHCTWILPWFIPDYFPSPYRQVRSALNTDRHTFIPSEFPWCHNIGQYHNEHLTLPWLLPFPDWLLGDFSVFLSTPQLRWPVTQKAPRPRSQFYFYVCKWYPGRSNITGKRLFKIKVMSCSPAHQCVEVKAAGTWSGWVVQVSVRRREKWMHASSLVLFASWTLV